MTDKPQNQDDPLLAIGKAMKGAEGTLDPRFDLLVRGELSVDQRAELERDAQGNPNLRAAIDLMTPISESTHRTIAVAAIEASKLSTLFSPARITAVAASVVAVVLAFVLIPTSPPNLLPAYELDYEQKKTELRGQTDEVAPDEDVSILLRPETSVDERLEARLYILRPNGEAVTAPLSPTDIRQGAVLWSIRLNQFVSAEDRKLRLVAVVAQQGHLPNRQTVMTGGQGNHWRLASRDLLLSKTR